MNSGHTCLFHKGFFTVYFRANENNDDHKVYACMAQMSSNDERSSGNYGDSSQLTNWIYIREQRAT